MSHEPSEDLLSTRSEDYSYSHRKTAEYARQHCRARAAMASRWRREGIYARHGRSDILLQLLRLQKNRRTLYGLTDMTELIEL